MSTQIIIAIGLVFVIEGLVWGLFPGSFRKLARAASEAPDAQLRLGGVVAVAIGVFIVWLVRG